MTYVRYVACNQAWTTTRIKSSHSLKGTSPYDIRSRATHQKHRTGRHKIKKKGPNQATRPFSGAVQLTQNDGESRVPFIRVL
ncbi:hypothetical protein VTO42DRAFT_4858 [Malbranchea cinnamomea]